MWTRYAVRWDFLTQLCGSVPADPEVVKAWLAARKPKAQPPNSKSLDEINEEVMASLAAEEEKASGILTFQRYEGGLVMRAATIRAHLKDCARVISSYTGKIEREKSFATRVINAVYLDPAAYWIPVLRPDGTRVGKHDGERDKAIHVRGPFGVMNALKRFEWVQPARMDFELWVLQVAGGKSSIGLKDLETVMQYGGVHGYAGERGDGEGRYTFTIEEIK